MLSRCQLRRGRASLSLTLENVVEVFASRGHDTKRPAAVTDAGRGPRPPGRDGSLLAGASALLAGIRAQKLA